ncbi:hypothetical protein EGR_11010 [Echinococcus granulosus]|uniref:Uncharacterized protein n=1 Tax=Echinococcus granulosus TaxID=6210 RepID=W6UKV8_ECHGR|nr:hypothetical protein EGR_11010 [Echinococcus granulosus]EUB54129.1 hypothetical protein EGR_11010 [Echinococcus granulosus]
MVFFRAEIWFNWCSDTLLLKCDPFLSDGSVASALWQVASVLDGVRAALNKYCASKERSGLLNFREKNELINTKPQTDENRPGVAKLEQIVNYM